MRMVRFTWVRFVVAGLLVLAGAIPALAQGQGNAVLTGTVLDPGRSRPRSHGHRDRRRNEH